ncbi:MAG: hypothetical protein HC842_00730 [Cytophagales bacterium]|nr:hypothetical protein [Cytophagales bacterium]
MQANYPRILRRLLEDKLGQEGALSSAKLELLSTELKQYGVEIDHTQLAVLWQEEASLDHFTMAQCNALARWLDFDSWAQLEQESREAMEIAQAPNPMLFKILALRLLAVLVGLLALGLATYGLLATR